MRSLCPALSIGLFLVILFLLALLLTSMAGNQQLQQELQTSQQEADALTERLGSVRLSFDSLKDSIAQFSDGASNWRDIVPEVENESEALDSELSEAEAAAEALQASLE